MKWREVYNKCNTKKYSRILEIKSPLILKSNINNFFKNNYIYLAIMLIIFILVAIYAIQHDAKILLACFGLFVAMFIALIYFNSYKIEMKEDELELTISFQKQTIKYDSLANIYLSKRNNHMLLFIPTYTYSINFIYLIENKPRLISLSTIMLDKQDVLKFFKGIKTEELEYQKEEDRRQQEQKNIKKVLIVTVLVILIITLIVAGIIISKK